MTVTQSKHSTEMRALTRNISSVVISIASLSYLCLHQTIFTPMASAPESSRVASLARALIKRESITPNDGGCQNVVQRHLKKLGFACETLRYHDVTNLWAHRGDMSSNPLVVFAGHTDVVPPGPLEDWLHPPFDGVIDDENVLHGRGAVDMKGGVAAFTIALEDFLEKNPEHSGSIGVILTSDEEGKACKKDLTV